MYDVIVIGAGAAGIGAGLAAAGQKLKTLILTKDFLVPKTGDFDLLDGQELYGRFERALQTEAEFLELRNKTEVTGLEKNVVSFSVQIKTGSVIYGRSVIMAVGKTDQIFDILTCHAGTNQLKVGAGMNTNVPGVFAAGDCNDTGRKNLLITAGEGARAAVSAKDYCTNRNP